MEAVVTRSSGGALEATIVEEAVFDRTNGGRICGVPPYAISTNKLFWSIRVVQGIYKVRGSSDGHSY